MNRLMIAVSILIIAAGAAVLNFTFTVTNASITSSQTTVSVSGPATLSVSGVGTDTGTFSASGSLANVSGGNVTVPFTVTLGYGSFSGTMTFPESALTGSSSVSGSATITSGTGRYDILGNTTISGSGFSGSVLSGGVLNFSISGTASGRSFTFSVTNAPITISGTSTFSGPASLTLAGSSDTGTFTAIGSLTALSGNLMIPFTVTLGRGTITGNMTYPETALLSSGPVSGSATITGGTGSYAGLTSSTLTASGTVTGNVLSGGTITFSVSGTVNTTGPAPPAITQIYNGSSRIPAGFSNSGITPSTLFAIEGSGLSDPNAPVVNQSTQAPGLPTNGLNGTTVSIVGSDGKTYTPGLYHALSFEIAGVVPAAVPTGTATFNVTYNGQTTSAQVQIVPYAYGFDIWDGNIAVATDAVTGALITPTNSATPDETLIFWGTGLGADPADSDTVYASNGGHAINTPAELYFGNVRMPTSGMIFEGSSVYPGVHIWGVTLPSNVPTGCAVSVAAVLGGNIVSNLPVLPISTNGGLCQDSVFGTSGSTVANILAQTTANTGTVVAAQTESPGQNGTLTTTDSMSATFQAVSGGSVFGSGSSISIGSCSLSEINTATYTAPTITALNAGTLTATPPAGSPITLTAPNGSGTYSTVLTVPTPATGTFGFSWTGASGTNAIGASQVSVTFPNPILNWANQAAAATITRANGLNVTWTNGGTNTFVSVSGTSQSGGTSATYTCLFPQAALQGTVPSYILGAFPAGSGTTTVGNTTIVLPFVATGIDYGVAYGLISFTVNSTYN